LYWELGGWQNQDSIVASIINGELINETEDKLPLIEPLYYTASVEDSTGNIILKTVNVQEHSVSVEIVLEALAKKDLSIEGYELSGYQLEDENNFENKELVSPKQTNFTTVGSSFSYEFLKQSVTIFRIK
jgi:alpha-L-arabinofuranosidase